ncbi:SseB family protein [Streptomyces celluloflavus]|uniref:SseB family protein n=1 Tax=Streptomyces kasugaensis TaxID=1946 RepID=A0A4Q9HIU0_STRKA|nr:SseB family protein [Streptomyces kasugaensis]TBO54517.1 SseB family protein [Streptomyces kasugaensis]WSK11405.1 SseB family protein [Streptomyces celluloflavus]
MQKNIPDPGYSDDDGSADPALAAALAAYDQDRGTEPQLLSALTGARVLVPVVAVLGETETGPDGLRREKTSDMAVPTLQAPDGRRALPAFTSMETLKRWRADARPVAVPLQQALLAAAHEKADTVVVDLAGPVTYQLTGAALRALAEGRESADPLADPAVTDALRALLAAEPGVHVAHLAPSAETDATLAIGLVADAPAAEVAERLARSLATDEVLRGRLVRGLDLALLPPGAAPAGEPLFRR